MSGPLDRFTKPCSSNNDEKRERKSDLEVSEDEKKTRIGLFKKKASKASSKFRRSLSRRRSSRSGSSGRTLSLTFEDTHDADELRYVSEFRQSLISDNLLPLRHDDYHMMLRSFVSVPKR